jgi:D-alanyl-D-alanine carboxypeptidase/D-alanyl-D-alanine-endopeptidase (penicillin-binding protein 4)
MIARMRKRVGRLCLASVCTIALAWLALAGTVSLGGLADAQAPPAEADAAALATPVLSARRVPDLIRSTITGNHIREAVAPLVEQAPPQSCVVVSTGGQQAVVREPSAPLAPGSTAKLLTGLAVLDALDPQSRLTTDVVAESGPDDGVIDGDLYLVGGGDPLLTTAGYEVTFPYPGQITLSFSELADRIVAAGVEEIRGGIVGDDSRYDQQRWVDSWPERYQREDTVGPLSALMVNEGSTGLVENPDEPATSRQPGDPPTLAAATLATLLEQRGVEVGGEARAGEAPDDTETIASLESFTIAEIVGEMVLVSDNTTAELLLKELGLATSGRGTTADGLAAVMAMIERRGLPTEGVRLLDGSGLDPESRVTCDLLVALLDQVGPDSALAQAMPVSADNGTLYNRMRRTAAAGQVRAKTGTLGTVNALAGYVNTEAGATLSFAYLVNGANQPRGYAPIDELMAALVAVPDGPPVEELAPEGVSG